MDQNKDRTEFKKSFRGYNVEEVDEYVNGAEKDIESLRGEVAELYKKLSEATTEIEKYRREEAVRGDIIREAKKNADDIMNDAKGRAARVIIRTSRQCNRIVADMVSQVEEQKNIYESTKREVLKFRSDLFSLYKDHIIRINAYSEAAGAFETDALSKNELDSFIKLLGDDPSSYSDDDSVPSYVASRVEEEVDKIMKSVSPSYEGTEEDAEEAAEEVEEAAEEAFEEAAEEETAPEEEYTFEETPAADEEDADEFMMPEETAAEETAAPYEDAEELDLGAAVAEEETQSDEYEFMPESLGEEEPEEFEATEIALEDEPVEYEAPEITFGDDPEEFGNEGEIENTVDEYDGPVSINDVFGTLDSYSDPDFEAVYGESYDEDEPKQKELTEEEILERRRRAEDDSNEFYTEADIEFDPLADPEIPTSQTGPMFDEVEKPKSTKKRWKIKRSMSITDEFKAIKSEDDND